MGAGQSNLYLYLGAKTKEYILPGYYAVKIRKFFSKICGNFVRFEFEIVYDSEPRSDLFRYFRYYDLTIYTGTDYNNLGEYVFCYYCNIFEKIVKRVIVYYSVLHPEVPLVIIFLTSDKKKYMCTYNTLKQAKWDYASSMSLHIFKEPLKSKLVEEFKKVSRGFKIKFSTGSGKNKGVKVIYSDVSSGNDYKIMIFKPSYNGAPVVSGDLFTSLKSNGVKNSIDPFYLSEVSTKEFDGIAIYYNATSSSNTVLLVEFFYDCTSKHQFVRKDKNSTWWEKKKVEFKDEASLSKELNSIKSDSDKLDFVTFILELKNGYNDVKVDYTDKSHNGYCKLTHSPSEYKLSNLMLKNTQIKSEKNNINRKLLNVSTFFLKNKDKNEDDTPFLIQFFEYKSVIPFFTKNFYTFYPKEYDKFIVWTEFQYPDKDLVSKLKEIDGLLQKEEVKEKKEFGELRKKAHEILVRPPPKPPPETKKETLPKPGPPSKPTEEKTVPEKKDEEPPLSSPAIAGISIGSLIGTGTVGGSVYGIYLYYNTIYLLT